MAIITAAEFKADQGIPDANTDYDDRIAAMIPQVQDIVEQEIGAKLDRADYTELFDGQGLQDLIVRRLPINSITSVKLSADTTTPVTLDADTYVHDGDRTISRTPRDTGARSGVDEWGRPISTLRNPYPVFTYGRQNVEVVYNAGYDTADVPQGLKRAAFWLLSSLFELQGEDVIFTQNKTEAGVSRSLRTAAESSGAIKIMLRPWMLPL